MRKFLLVTVAAMCGLATPVFASIGTSKNERQIAVSASITVPNQQTGSFSGGSVFLLAQNGPPTTPPGNSGTNGNDNGNNGQSGKPVCDDVSPSHPCKGNNGFGNGGNDGSPNGFPNGTTR